MSSELTAQPRPFTVEDLFSLPDDGKRYEIYDGEIYMGPPPNLDHQHVSKELQFMLTSYLKERDLGELYNAPIALVLSATNYTEPDLVYVSREREAVLTDRGIEGAPDLVVEILSPSTKRRDIEVKRAMYQRAQIPHYWIVDPVERVLLAMALQGDGYAETARVGAGETFRPVMFPGLSIPLDALWRRPE